MAHYHHSPPLSFGHEEEQQTHLPVEQGLAGAAPVVPAIFISSDVREPANLPALEAGDARGSTGVRDHISSMMGDKKASVAEQRGTCLPNRITRGQHPPGAPIFAPVAEQTGIRLLNGLTQVQFLPGALRFSIP